GRLVADIPDGRPRTQSPVAIVLGCSDARVPAEIVLDQGLGDLFVIRVAGNIAGPSQLGSMEYAAATFGTRLIVVLGHSDCGAVKAALDYIEAPDEAASANHRFIVDRIAPALIGCGARQEPAEDRVGYCVRANISAAIRRLHDDSGILGKLIDSGELLVVGAEYSLETGVVDFFQRPDAATGTC
ncbi:MAG: carbonic anhydrase, partial [Pseudomonadota bacterium]